MSLLKKGKKESMRKKFLNSNEGTFMKSVVPKGVKTISQELVEGKENLLTMMKYGTLKMGVKEHFNQKIRYQFYSEDEDYNYTIEHSELDNVFKNINTSEQEFMSEMDNKWNPTILNWITEIKTQQISKGKVEDSLIECMDFLLPIYLKTTLILLMKKVFKDNPSFIHPPQSLFKNTDKGCGDVQFILKRKGDSVGLTLDFNQFKIKGDGVWIDTIFSGSTLIKEEIEGLKSLEEEQFESELNNLLEKKGINKN